MSWILVIAGNQSEHDAWERVHPTGRYIYLRSPQVLQGINIDSIILTGRWWENPVLRQHGGWDLLRPYLAHRCHMDAIQPREIIFECQL